MTIYKMYMNLKTGSTGTYEEGETVNAVDLGEVEEITGDEELMEI